jgi:hypothetical protein
MRLLSLDDDGSFSLTQFPKDKIPPYAILSHTWGRGEDDEVVYKDIIDGTGNKKKGFQKLQFCGIQAKADDLHYFWVDTCCINKSDKGELRTAINSMFRWYQNATRCYVYLSDVSANTQSKQSRHVESAFHDSLWFTRGWTLQELLAPKIVEFFSCDCTRLGDKRLLEQQIHKITGIAIQALQGCHLSEFTVEERFRWVESRQTTKEEDKTYCLVGIFGVNLSLSYGEGQTHAMTRLKSEINENMECLQHLYMVNPEDEMTRIENNKDKLLYASYEWILHHDEYVAFTTWAKSNRPPCRLLWIKGHAGTGKTMLLIGIIRELLKQPSAFAPSLSYFFYQDTGTRIMNSATVALRCLIWMLLVQQPHLISHLQIVYKKSGKRIFEDGNEFFALSRVFQNMLIDPGLSPAYLLVDALDECDQTKPGLDQLIQLISTSLTLSKNVRWLLSSRPEVDVLSRCKKLSRDTLDHSGILVELDTECLAGPVNAYINYKLTNLRGRRGYNDSNLAEISNEVHRRAMNTFLWVALAFKTLETVHGRYAVKRIKEIPPGLVKLYDHMMARIENINEVEPEDCKQVLIAVCLAFRPLSLSELATVADLPPDIAEAAIEICGSFLSASEDEIYLIHQSAKDYLEKNYESKLQDAGINQGHSDISRRSIMAMSSVLKQNIYGLPFGLKPKDISPPDPDPLDSIRYSCVYWIDHICSLNSERSEYIRDLMDYEPVFEFLTERFLRWLESLSLLGRLADGIQSIRRLLCIIQV